MNSFVVWRPRVKSPARIFCNKPFFSAFPYIKPVIAITPESITVEIAPATGAVVFFRLFVSQAIELAGLFH